MSQLKEMAEMLEAHGPQYTGGNAYYEAQRWIYHGFSVEDADEWCGIGVWDAETAARLRNAGLTPRQAAAAAKRLTDGLEDPSERYTDGDPLYSVCNGDTSIDEIIGAVED